MCGGGGARARAHSTCSSQKLTSRVLPSLMAFPHCFPRGLQLDLQLVALAAVPVSVGVGDPNSEPRAYVAKRFTHRALLGSV